MADPLDDKAFDVLFRDARTYGHWLDRPVTDQTLRALWDLMKWAPTSANSNPVRILFLRTHEAKQRLVPALSQGNVAKVLSAPVTAIIAYDLHFYDNLPKLAPHNPVLRDHFIADPQLVEVTARRNSSLQGAYFIIAARALGLDCGPLSGFDNAKVDEEFFGCGKERDPDAPEFFTAGHYRSNFLCNLGHGDTEKIRPRQPRLDFEDACRLL